MVVTTLLLGWLAHAFAAGRAPENFAFGVAGMALTFTALLGAACSVLALAVLRLFE